MPSIVWNRDPEEAYSNPYEYGAQEQFVREAKQLLLRLLTHLEKQNLSFGAKEVSVRKASWMLYNDALDALRASLELLELKKHVLVGRIFRDVWEASQMAEHFHSRTPQSQTDLRKWFENEIIEHRKIRERLEKSGKKSEAEQKRLKQRELSKFTHRSYRALLKGYSLGRDDMLVYDGYSASCSSTHTLAAYYAVLGDLILQTLESLKKTKFISDAESKKALRNSLEKKTVPRRFAQTA